MNLSSFVLELFIYTLLFICVCVCVCFSVLLAVWREIYYKL